MEKNEKATMTMMTKQNEWAARQGENARATMMRNEWVARCDKEKTKRR